jgi:hypothetical protein
MVKFSYLQHANFIPLVKSSLCFFANVVPVDGMSKPKVKLFYEDVTLILCMPKSERESSALYKRLYSTIILNNTTN